MRFRPFFGRGNLLLARNSVTQVPFATYRRICTAECSIAALIGLTAIREGVQLPLATWGAGTRRIAALTIAEQNQGEAPITLVL